MLLGGCLGVCSAGCWQRLRQGAAGQGGRGGVASGPLPGAGKLPASLLQYARQLAKCLGAGLTTLTV